MTNIKLLLAILMASSTLVACGGSSSSGGGTSSSSSSSSSGGDCEDTIAGCAEEDPVTQLDITNEPLPLIEQFEVNAGENENRAMFFFSPEYKVLNSETPQTVTDADGNEVVVEDPHPSFYYPTCCLWQDDPETGEQTDQPIEDLDHRQFVGNGYMAMSNARFSVGQLMSDLVSAEDSESGDPKTKTTDAPVGSSWGELDLSEAYRVSFCLRETGVTTGGTGGNMEIYVDNNSGGNQGHSIHGDQSLLLRTPAELLDAGNRVVIDVPGEARLVDNSGVQHGEIISTTAEVFGTEHSFLQMRVSSGAFAVISDLVVEPQDQDNAAAFADCVATEGLYTPEPEPTAQGTPFAGLPLTVDLNMTFDEFFGKEGTKFLAISDSPTQPFYFDRAGSSRMFVANNAITWGDGRFYVGHKVGGKLLAEGDIDLSVPYKITFDVVKANDAGGNFMIYVDNTESGVGDAESGWNSVHEDATKIYSTTLDLLADGQTVEILSDVGTAGSFFQFRCDSGCGQPDGPDSALGVTIENINIEYQGEGPAADAWTAGAHTLFGTPDTAPSGSVSENTETSLTMTAMGGKVNSSNHAFYYAHKVVEMSDFAFTAQVTAITPPASGDNGYRFGMYVTTGLTPVDVYTDLSAYAGLEFYMNTGVLTGSRIVLKDGGSRSRSDVGEPMGVGDWIRTEITDDGTDKRVTWYISHDDGVTWVEESSKSGVDFAATAADDTWYVGFAGAPGTEVTMEFDNISIEPLTP